MRYAVTVHVTQEVKIMADARTPQEAASEAERVAMRFRNAVAVVAISAKPADTKTLQEARR